MGIVLSFFEVGKKLLGKVKTKKKEEKEEVSLMKGRGSFFSPFPSFLLLLASLETAAGGGGGGGDK